MSSESVTNTLSAEPLNKDSVQDEENLSNKDLAECSTKNPSGVAETSVVKASVVETSGVETSGVETSGVETSGVETSGVETSGVETSGVETSGVETSGVETSVVKASVVETSGVEASGVETSGVETSVEASVVEASVVEASVGQAGGQDSKKEDTDKHNGSKVSEKPVNEETSPVKKKIDINDPPLCKSYFNNKKCFNKADCLFTHKKYPCKSFHTKAGECDAGDKCKFSHKLPLNSYTEQMLQKVVDGDLEIRNVGNIMFKYRVHLNAKCKEGENCKDIVHKTFPCKNFHMLNCTNGDTCQYSHEPLTELGIKLLEQCLVATTPIVNKFYKIHTTRKCTKGAACQYAQKRLPCQSYHVAGKCFQGENICIFSHEPLTEEDRRVLLKTTPFPENFKKRIYSLHWRGKCDRGDGCFIVHKKFPCKYYHIVEPCNLGDKCSYSHEPLTNRTREILLYGIENPRSFNKRLSLYHMNGQCSKGEGCYLVHKKFPCKAFHIDSNCSHGDKCEFSHKPLTPRNLEILKNLGKQIPAEDDSTPGNQIDVTDPPLCESYFNTNECEFKDDCLFIHKKYPCKSFHTTGECELGEKCKYTHEPLNDDTQIMLQQVVDDKVNVRPAANIKARYRSHLNGGCKNGRECKELIHKKFPCKYFHLFIQCSRGENCQFSHEPLDEINLKLLEQCVETNIPVKNRFYKIHLTMKCSKGEACPYAQEKLPCRYLHIIGKCFYDADNCAFSHQPLTDDTQQILEKELGFTIDKIKIYQHHFNGECTSEAACEQLVHKTFPCKPFHMDLKCNKGDSCTFSHEPLDDERRKILKLIVDLSMPEAERRFYRIHLNAKCNKAEECQLEHKKFPCLNFHLGYRCNQAEYCEYSHGPISNDNKKILEEVLDLATKSKLLKSSGHLKRTAAGSTAGNKVQKAGEPLKKKRRRIRYKGERRELPYSDYGHAESSYYGSQPRQMKVAVRQNRFPSLMDYDPLLQSSYAIHPSRPSFNEFRPRNTPNMRPSYKEFPERRFRSSPRESPMKPQRSSYMEPLMKPHSSYMEPPMKQQRSYMEPLMKPQSSYMEPPMKQQRSYMEPLMKPQSSYPMKQQRSSYMEPPMKRQRSYMEPPMKQQRSSYMEPPMKRQKSSFKEPPSEFPNSNFSGENNTSEFWKSLQKWVTLLPNVLENQTPGAESVTGLKQLLGKVNEKLGISGQEHPTQGERNNQSLKKKSDGQRPCWFFLKGRCTKGANCPLSHSKPSLLGKRSAQKTKQTKPNSNNAKRFKSSQQPWLDKTQSAGHQNLGFGGSSRNNLGPSHRSGFETQLHSSHDQTARQGFGRQSFQSLEQQPQSSFGLPDHADHRPPAHPDPRPQLRSDPRPPSHLNVGMAPRQNFEQQPRPNFEQQPRPNFEQQPRPNFEQQPRQNFEQQPRPSFEQQPHHVGDNSEYAMRDHHREPQFFNTEMQHPRRAETVPGRNEEFLNNSGPPVKQFADSSFNEYMRPQTQYMNEPQQYVDTGRQDGSYDSEMYQHQGNRPSIRTNEAVDQFVEHQRNISTFSQPEQPRSFNTGDSWNQEYSGRNDQSFQAAPQNYSTNRKRQWSDWSSQYGNQGENRRGGQAKKEKVSIPWMHFE